MPHPHVLVFDVMGTVVDDEGSLGRGTAAVLRRAGVPDGDIEQVLEASADRLQILRDEASAQRRAWPGHRALRVLALVETLAALDQPPLDPQLVGEVARLTDRLEPWPDSAAALDRLRRSFTTVALSNADLAELAAMSAHGGLAWHLTLSAEQVHRFKPDPAMYRLALAALDVAPEHAMMVAAHPWDLRAAAELGLRTAFVARPGADPPRAEDRFDLVCTDLSDLAGQLAA